MAQDHSRRFFLTKTVAVAAAVLTAAPAILSAHVLDEMADRKLLALADELVIAEQRYADLMTAVDHMTDHTNPPEALRIRPRDLELGRKPHESADEFWHRPCDIDQWRTLDKWKTEVTKTDDRMEMVQWRTRASDELQLRGSEIVAAFEAWYNKKPRGYKKALRELARASKAYDRLEIEVANTPATTLEGMQAKIRCARAWEREEIESITGGCAEAMALSIFKDIERLF
jgi:hypothetical protein